MTETQANQLARQVLRIRNWQHIVNETMKRGDLKLPVHMAFGHEAIAVAVSEMMTDDDRLILTHRNIAHNLARQGELQPVFDEYTLSPGGLAHGTLGCMNLANPDRGVVYVSSILGNNMPVACGFAMAKEMKQEPGIVTVLTGDGAMEEGTFYESLLVSKSQGLPLLLVIENNDFSLASTIPERRCPVNVEHFCCGLDVPYVALSGNDVDEYADTMKACRSRVLDDSTPVCVEVDLQILNRHAGPTPGWPEDPLKVDYGKGLVLREDRYDPVFVLKQRLPAAEYDALEKEALDEDWSD